MTFERDGSLGVVSSVSDIVVELGWKEVSFGDRG